MPDYHQGLVLVTNSSGGATISFDGSKGRIVSGGSGKSGDLCLRNGDQVERLWLQGVSGSVIADGHLWVGPLLAPGVRPLVFDGSELTIWHKPEGGVAGRVLRFRGKYAHLQLGDAGNGGELVIYDDERHEGIRARANEAFVRVGGSGNRGRVMISDDGGVDRIHLDGRGFMEIRDDNGDQTFGFNSSASQLVLGRTGNGGRIVIYGDTGGARIDIDGGDGDIKLHGADCAERFDIEDQDSVTPGTVLVIGEDEKLVPCSRAYDRRVAGVVSGAGPYAPGVILDCGVEAEGRLPVALSGKVHCNVDATLGAIAAGDLLTTADRCGFAMKASDRERSFGTVLGKALRGLAGGLGQVPMLVSLQ